MGRGQQGGKQRNAVRRQRRGATQRARRRRRMLIVFYLLIFLFVVTAAVSLSLTVLFRVTDIEINNTTSYSQEEILKASGLTEGENLFLADVDGAKTRIETTLPYTGEVKVERKIPSTISITVDTAEVAAAVEQENGQILLVDDSYKILEIVRQAPDDVLLIKGLQAKNPDSGYTAQWEEEETASVLNELLKQLEKDALSPITSVDVQNLYRLTVVYDGRITINFGGPDDLDLKVASVKKIVTENLSKDDRGTLDASLTRDSKRVYFNPESAASSGEESASSEDETGSESSQAGEESAGESAESSGETAAEESTEAEEETGGTEGETP